jgi:hypothetical protein
MQWGGRVRLKRDSREKVIAFSIEAIRSGNFREATEIFV